MSGRIDEAIHNALRERLDAEVDKVVEEAKEKVEKAIRAQLAHTVLTVLKMYEIQQDADKLIITVKTDA